MVVSFMEKNFYSCSSLLLAVGPNYLVEWLIMPNFALKIIQISISRL